jgi:hypothetical protein
MLQNKLVFVTEIFKAILIFAALSVMKKNVFN